MYSKIETGHIPIFKGKIKELSKSLQNNKVKSWEAIYRLSEIWNTKVDFKRAAELEVIPGSRSNFLHLWTMLNFSSLINFLLSKNPKINLNIMNNKGETPLHIAVNINNIAMIKMLIHLGASLKPRNFEGKSPQDLLKEQNLLFLIHKNNREEMKLEITVTSRTVNSQIGTVNVNIEETKNEIVEDMFSNIRDYFKSEGKLSPKLNRETIEMDSSLYESDGVKFKASIVSGEDWNISFSEISRK